MSDETNGQDAAAQPVRPAIIENPDEQLRLLERRFRSVGVSRRTFLKIAAGATAGTAAHAGIAKLVQKAEAAPAKPKTAWAGGAQTTEEQIFYHLSLRQEPKSQDFNLDLYCNGEPELWASLLMFDENLTAVPDWAEKYEPNADGSVWTFHIRPNNKGWSNGDPVTAHDFVWSWERQLNPANGASYAFFLYDIKNALAYNTPAQPGTPSAGPKVTAADLGMKALDDWTLQVTCEGPRAYFPQVIAYVATVPAHRPSVEKYGDKWATGDVPLVSNGPFMMQSWEHEKKITLVKNPNYWNAESIHLTKVIDPIIPDANSVLAYESGQGDQRLDWTFIGAADLPRYQKDPNLSKQLHPYVQPLIWMILPSNGIPPFDRLEVRRALSHSIDRERLAKLTNGLETPAYCMVPAGVFGHFDDPEFEQIQDFNPQKAMAALKGTPFEGGKNWPPITMTLRAQEENINSNVMAEDIAAQAKEVLGMDIKLSVLPENTFRPTLYQNKLQLVWIRWYNDYPDPNNSYGDMFYSRKASGKRQAWSNKEFDDLVEKGKAETDPQKRLDIYKQCERIIQQDVGYIPVVYRYDQVAWKPWVKDVPVNQQGFWVPEGNIYNRLLTKLRIEGRTNK